MTNRWIASYEMADDGDYLEHYGRLGMKWGQHIFAKDPAKGRKYIDKKRKALSANVALAKDAARRGNAKRLAQLNKKTKKMVADVKQLEEAYEQATGQKYSSSKPGEAEDAVTQTKQTSKETILKTGSAKDVFAIKDQLTQSELQDAINRIQKENTLAGLKASEVQQKIDNAKNFTNTIINAGNTAVNAFNAYENVAKMVNTISGEDTLPVFTGRKEKASKEAEKARAKKVKGIIERSDAQEITDNIHLFTNNEVQEAKKRLDNIKAIEKQIKHSDLSDDELMHYGRLGMKWGQHIFGKEPTGRYTKKKRAKMVKKYGEKDARLREAKSVRNAYIAARYNDKKHTYDKSDYAEYAKTIGDIVKEGTTNYDVAKQIANINKKEVRLYEAYQDADYKRYNYWVDTQNMIRDAADNNKELGKEWYRKRDKESQRLDKLTDKLYDSYSKVIDQRLELSREWTEDVFGTKPSDSFGAKEMQETGMNFITSLPDSFYKEFDEYFKIRR